MLAAWISCPLRFSIKIKNKLLKIVNNTFFNGLIMSLKISLFKNCFSIGNQIKLAVYKSRFQTKANIVSSVVLFGILVVIMIGTARLLWTKFERLGDPKFVNRCGNLYSNAPLNRDKPFILRFPLLILHRLCFVSLASGLHQHIAQSIQLLLLGNLFFTMFILNYRPSV